jgi:SAM-dependent methyltransferase
MSSVMLLFVVAVVLHTKLYDSRPPAAQLTLFYFVMSAGGALGGLFTATLGLFLLFTLAVALHAELYRLRPEADHLTAFYLAMAAGGVLGGLFCALVAPTLFDWAYEHPILIVAGALMVPQRPLVRAAQRLPFWSLLLLVGIALLLSLGADLRPFGAIGKSTSLAMSVAISLIGLVFIGRPIFFAITLAALMLSYGGWTTLNQSREGARTRSYFGVYTVSERLYPPSRLLTHGTTLHGIENLTPGEELEPTSYYARRSGVGHALASAPVLFGPQARIGIVGLGTGTLACYALPGQSWKIFEIDPAVVRIASDPANFSFLSRCAPDAEIVVGDARVSLSRQPPGGLDLLAVDAFSSDAVPMHLLTREALAVYARALQPGGLLLVHISNRYLDLEPVLAAAEKEDGWSAMIATYSPGPEEAGHNLTTSIWVAMSRDPRVMDSLKLASGGDADLWRPLAARPGFPGWSDDYASILPLLEDWSNWVPTQ